MVPFEPTDIVNTYGDYFNNAFMAWFRQLYALNQWLYGISNLIASLTV